MSMSLPPDWRYSSMASRSASEISLVGAFMNRASASSGTPSTVSRESSSVSNVLLFHSGLEARRERRFAVACEHVQLGQVVARHVVDG